VVVLRKIEDPALALGRDRPGSRGDVDERQELQDNFHIGADGERILQGWLDRRPEKAYFQEGLRDIVRLAYAPDEWKFDVDDLRGLLAHAAAIARTTATAMDEPTAPSEADERALADLARELGIDNVETWGALVRELTEPPRG
jgi:hypothetical protein